MLRHQLLHVSHHGAGEHRREDTGGTSSVEGPLNTYIIYSLKVYYFLGRMIQF